MNAAVKVALPDAGPPVAPPAPLVAAVALDVLVALAAVVGGALAASRGAFPGAPWAPWALVAAGLVLLAVDVGVGRMHPTALTWRRRFGYAVLAALAWRGGPFAAAPPWATVLVVAWVGATWVALVLGGRALSRAIAGATGEDRPE